MVDILDDVKVDGKIIAKQIEIGDPDSPQAAATKQYVDRVADDLSTHVADVSNPHGVTKEQVGLEKVDNTSDADKPISTATQSALDGKVSKSGDTMTGELTMKKRIQLNYDSPSLFHVDTGGDTTTDTTRTYFTEYYRDKNNRALGTYYARKLDGINVISLNAISHNSSDAQVWGTFGVASDGATGQRWAFAPNWAVGTNDNSDKILTIQMANSLPSLCHTTGNEMWGGTKIFTNPPFVNIPINAGSGGNGIFRQISFADNNNAFRGGIRTEVGNIQTVVSLRAYDMNGMNPKSIEVVCPSSGDGYALAPSTPANATTNQIATADWVLDKFSALPKVYRPCGSVATFDQLPTNASVGDVYNVESDNQNYAWVEIDGVQKWDSLGATIDLTQYYTKTDVDGKLSEVRTIADGKVSKGGDTMTGQLTLEANPRAILIKNTSLTVGTPIATFRDIVWRPNDQNVEMGLVRCGHDADGKGYIRLRAFNTDAKGGDSVHLFTYLNGTTSFTAPTPSNTSDNSTKVATTSWINTADVICRTVGNQTISGEKTFTAPWTWVVNQNGKEIILKNTSITGSETGERNTVIRHTDNNDILRGALTFTTDGDHTSYTKIVVGNAQNSRADLTLRIDSTGKAYATCPNPSSTATSNEIVTANWSLGKFVKKAGDTMTGELIAKGGVRSDFIRKWDANNQNVGFVLFEETETSNTASLNARKSTGTDTAVYPALKLFANSDGTYYATLHSNYIGWNDNSDKVLTIKMANSLPSLCHTTGNETWSGSKSFTSNVNLIKSYEGQFLIQATSVTRGTIPNSDLSPGRFRVTDGANATFGEVYTTLGADGSSSTTLCAVKNQTSRADAYIVVGWKADGTKFATAPTTSSTATSNEIATADWCHNNFVNVSGDVMGGTLTFYKPWIFQKSANADNIILKNTSITGEETGNRNMSIDHTDNNNVIRGQILYSTNKYHMSSAYLVAGNGNGATQSISVTINPDGTSNANAPTPSNTTDNSTQIATTEWINTADIICRTAGNQTVSGIKTFTSQIKSVANSGYIVNAIFNSYKNGDTPSSSLIERTIRFEDNSGLRIGQLVYSITSSKQRNFGLTLFNENQEYKGLVIRTLSDGTFLAEAPPTPSDATGSQIVTAGWSLDKFVQKSGDTMTGVLELKENTNVTISIEKGQAGAGKYRDFTFYDKGDSNGANRIRRGNIRCEVGNVQTAVHLRAFKFDGSGGASLTVIQPETGDACALAPNWSVGTDTNDDKILTMKMANSLPSLCHSSGNETWSGDKTFSSRVYLNNSLRIKPTASSTRRAVVFNKVSDSSEMGWIGYVTDTDNMLINLVSGDYVSINKSTPSNATGTEIATADWVNNKLNNKIVASTTDIGEGSALATGTLYVVYE